MRSIDDHLAQVRSLYTPPALETRRVRAALGYRLTRPVRAAAPSPRFDNSQMDGFAVDAAALGKLPATLPVGPTIAAGTDPDTTAPGGIAGRALPVMTGAKLPRGTAAVVPVEDCEPDDFDAADARGEVHVGAASPGQFVRKQGSDLGAGETLVEAGTLVTPIVLAALITAGVKEVEIRPRARAVLVTGGAEVTAGDPAATHTDSAAQIPDANRPMLAALCRAHHIDPVGHVSTDDDPQALRAALTRACEEHDPDVIITSGGISQGRFEVVRTVLGGDGSWFGRVAQQPGGPQGTARLGDTPVICLPGNPISTLVSFRVFVAPVIGKATPAVTARLTEPVEGLKGERLQWRRGFFEARGAELYATAYGGTGSHLISQAVGANCLIAVPSRAEFSRGDQVTVLPLDSPGVAE